MSEAHEEVDLAQLIRDDDGAPYADEAAARGIAIVMKLFEQGHYSWPEWVDKFSVEISPPGHYRHSAEAARAAEAVLTGDGKSINRNYAKLWLAACEKLLLEKGLLTATELDARLAAQPTENPAGDAFAVGDRVVVRDVEPVGHAHLPLFVRGKAGVVERRLGDFTFPVVPGPDGTTDVGESNRQPVYSVRFAARELWGPDAPSRDSLNFSIWHDYLKPA
ncbi:MAG: nitrile hydratase subunit beta [Alphaproteobacteria bacterium]|jgi:nitrile hydratase|nr:nitrile hydratase subunit beta [Alphaproteobacteria bacterium]MDP6564943.1 nitrile hydratase subunit beta [Alphaproteobacteria bacterium]